MMSSCEGASPDPEPGEVFVRSLVRLVRDPAISDTLAMADDAIRGAIGAAWRNANESERLTLAVAYAVDSALCELLNAIGNRVLNMSWTTEDGQVVDLASSTSGDLTGEFITNGGWRDQFSDQPHFPFH